MNKVKNVHIFGGGTVNHITSHFSVCSPAYGTTAKKLEKLCKDRFKESNIHLELTKMAGGSLETNDDVLVRVNELKNNPKTKVIFFNCAIVDWVVNEAKYLKEEEIKLGKYESRMESRHISSNDFNINLKLTPSKKIIPLIRNNRKDIFLVGFKTTCGASKQEMYEKGLRLCKDSVNLVLVNDVKTRWNMIITPEEASYHESDDRDFVLKQLVDMAWYRSQLTFTQSTVIAGSPVSWYDDRIPNSLRTVVDYCVEKNAYKPFKDATVGHFAIKLSDNEFLTSIRKSNFNNLKENGLVYVKTDGPDSVIAYGAKPSVGGQSQRIIFKDHPGYDCIVHFHCPLRDGNKNNIPIRSQREVECGSHQCGENTNQGLKQFGNLKVVMLDKHGPNIIFNKNTDPLEVIYFIEENFELDKKTGGYNL